MRTLRQILTEKCEKDGTMSRDIDDELLEETLREDYLTVWEGDDESHRWRIEFSVVVKIIDDNMERFFCMSACKGTNDNSWEDAGYYFEGIDKVCEVYPHEVTTTVYKREM